MIDAAGNRQLTARTARDVRSWIRRADTLVEAFERRQRPLPKLAARMRKLRALRDEARTTVRALERPPGSGRAAARRELSAARRHLADSWRDVVSAIDACRPRVVSGAPPQGRG